MCNTKNMKFYVCSTILMMFIFSQASCSTLASDKVVNYEELVSEFKSNEETNLCYWYYDGLSSNKSDEYYFFSYICAPSENYTGSRIIVKERVKIEKSKIDISGIFSDGGKVTLSNLAKK